MEKLCKALWKSKLNHKRHYKKWFLSYTEMKNRCSWPLKLTFHQFFVNFWMSNWNRLLEEQDKAFKIAWIQIWSNKHFWIWLHWEKKRMFWTFELDIFHIFSKFLSDKVESVFWESKVMHWKLFKSKASILENCFEVIFRSKAIVLNLWKWTFSLFR